MDKVLLVVCWLAVACSAQWVFDPVVPIVNLPFRVSTSLQVSRMFVSGSSACSDVVSGGSSTLLSGGSAVFQVYAQNVTRFHFCDSQTYVSLTSINFVRLTFSPLYAIRSVVTRMTFPSFTPNGTMMLREYSDCSGGIGGQQDLSLTKTADVAFSTSGYYFVCLTLYSGVVGRQETTNIGQLVVTDPASFNPQTAITFQSLSFETSGAAPPNANVFFSSSVNCNTTSQGPLRAGGSFGKTFSTQIQLQQGEYTFCVEIPVGSGVYVPSGSLQVSQYSVVPATAFENTPTVFTAAQNSLTVSTAVALSLTRSCVSPFVIVGTPVGGKVTWSLAQGTYFSCIYNVAAQTYILASQHLVAQRPNVELTSEAVRALPLTLLSSAVSAVLGDFSRPSMIFNFSSGASTRIVPADAQNALTLWVPTDDYQYWYNFGDVVVRDFFLIHLPLFVGEPSRVTVDNGKWNGFQLRFSFTSSCMNGEDFVLPLTAPIVLTASGAASICVNGSQFGFQLASSDEVFEVPSVTPPRTLENKSTQVSVFRIPRGQLIYYDHQCTNSSNSLASSGFETKLEFSSTGTTFFCSTFKGTAGLSSLRLIGSISALRASIRPSVQVVNTESTYYISIGDPALLVGQKLFVSSDCSQQIAPVAIELRNQTFVATLTPIFVGDSLHICVGNETSPFVSIGRTSVVPPFVVTQPVVALPQLPFQISVVGTSFQPSQIIVSSSKNCNGQLFMTASLTNGAATLRLPLPGQYFVCVLADDGSTVLQGGDITLGTFSSASTTLLRLQPNDVVVSSAPQGSSIFLSQFPNCTGAQFTATPLLSAPAGRYTVCQQLGGFSTGSTNTVLVIDQFSATSPPAVFAFVPFNVNLSRGDLSERQEVSVFLTLTNCSADPIGEFSSSNPFSVVVTIPTIANVRSVLCITSTDGLITSQIASFLPLPYMTPQTIPSGVPVTITSGVRSTGFGVISPTASCGSEWTTPALISQKRSSFTVPVSTSTIGYYCEGASASQLELRGVLNIVHLNNPDGTQAVIRNQTVLPGVTVLPDVDVSVVTDPFFSSSSSCNSRVDLSRGWIPEEDADVRFFVCVLSADQTWRFTTPYPTVRILGFSVAPKAFSSGEEQQFSFSSSLPSETVLSVSSTKLCNDNVSAAAGISTTGFVFPSALLDGIYYLCAKRSGETTKAISSMLISRPPSKQSQTLAIVGVPICFSLQFPSRTFSLVDESLPSYDENRQYFKSSNRSFFMSSSLKACQDGIGTGFNAVGVTNITNICVNPVALPSVVYWLCVGVPSGFSSPGTVSFTTVSVSPETVVSGGFVPLALSNAPSATFALSTSSSCSFIDSAVFTTDSLGIASQFRASSTNGSFLAAGLFKVCLLSPTSTFVPISTVNVTRPIFFSLSNNRIVVQVPTTVDLLQDLTTDAILGFRTTPSCDTPSAIVTLSTTDSTTISVTAASAGVAYLCARTPVNNTIVSVSTFTIVAPFVQFTAQVSTCTDVTVGVNAPGTWMSLALIDSDYCCGAEVAGVLLSTNSPSPSLRKIRVTDSDLERFAPRTSFSLCAVNTSSCFNLGQIGFVSSSCANTPTPQTPVPDNQQGTNGTSNNNRQDLATSSTPDQSKQITPTIILAAVFVLLLLIVVIVIVIQCCLRSRRVIPADVEDGNENPTEETRDDEWRRTFDSILNTNKRGGNTAVVLNQLLHVPISMRLDTCREAPIPIQLLELHERDARASLVEIERNTFLRLTENIMNEASELRRYHAAVEKTRVLQNVSMLLQAEVVSLAELEEASRTEIMDEEEGRRLTVADFEKQQWRHQVDLEGQRLKDALERDPFWRNRRRLLREAHARAMQSVQASPAAFDPTPNRTLMVDQTDLESRYEKDPDMYY